MTSLTVNLPDEKFRRLKRVAQLRGTSVDKLLEEVTTRLLTEVAAEKRFRVRAERGRGKENRGLELLRKAAGNEREG